MKALLPASLLLVASVFLVTTPRAEARDKHKQREAYSSDHARDIRDAQAREAKRRQDAYEDYRNDRRRSNYSRSGYNYYPGYRYGGYNNGYNYGRPRTNIAIGVSPSYSTQYVERDRSVYRGQAISGSNNSSLEISVQNKLGRLGYYSGEYDGDIGPASRRAILKYQRDNDLEETGRIDRELVNALDLT